MEPLRALPNANEFESIIEKIKEEIAPKDLHQVDIDDDDIVFTMLICAPSRIEWMKYLSDLSSTDDIGKKVQAHENAVLASTKWPDRESVRQFFNRKFGSLGEVIDKISELVGAGAKVRTKKL